MVIKLSDRISKKTIREETMLCDIVNRIRILKVTGHICQMENRARCTLTRTRALE